MDFKSSPFSGILLTSFLALPIAVGCRGPMGPAGLDQSGVDILPPTVVIQEPLPLDEIWDEITISASAIDNVAISEVAFLLDGSAVFGGRSLIVRQAPFAVTVSLNGLSAGWHFIAGRAYDDAGNRTQTPMFPVKVGFSRDLRDTLVYTAYHRDEIAAVWTIPDTARSQAYWVKFDVARECELREINFMMGAKLSDTAEVSITIYRGAEFPTARDTTMAMFAFELSDSLTLRTLSLAARPRVVRNDFFVVVGLTNNTAADTLKIGADGGEPFRSRSGARNDEGWTTLSRRFARRDNLMIGCALFYEALPDDST